MKIIKIFLSLILIIFIHSGFADSSLYPFNSREKAKHFQEILEQTRCVVCQNQSIKDSEAPLAKDLRAKIYKMVNENQSDAEINTFLLKRYGNFILLKPPLTMLTWVLWFTPIVGIFFAFYFLLLYREPKK